MDLYPWVVFIHAATILLFFIAHGTSMAVAFRLRHERDPERVRALLQISTASLGTATIVLVTVGLVSGIAAGFMGGWWGRLWIWISLALFLAVAFGMTPMAAIRFGAMRTAAGVPSTKAGAEPPTVDLEELKRLLDAWNPVPIAAIGLLSFVLILWLMLAKPF